MKIITPLTILTLFLFSSASQSSKRIDSKDAPFNIGEEVVACGVLKEVSPFKKGLYLNMDAAYPKQSMTFVLWNDSLTEFQNKHGSLHKLTNSKICGKGTVTEYRNKIQVQLDKAFSLQVVDEK